ncbi:unnamed protein product [Triticum turgidum subsp. durum]|uniref:Anaphase-promoting complex subunit 11 n=4 Tax=Triticinae TaxID=1648030 RepID=A0A9R0WCB1_TRITD|nr:unnamed protein product [Triticum turgidum subsp. durum]
MGHPQIGVSETCSLNLLCRCRQLFSICQDKTLLSHVTAMKVKILQWHAVASWTWDAQDETCGICRMAFDGCCPDCKFPGDDCPIIWGACNHAFHLHCILKWVNSQTSTPLCPMCRREWQFKG